MSFVTQNDPTQKPDDQHRPPEGGKTYPSPSGDESAQKDSLSRQEFAITTMASTGKGHGKWQKRSLTESKLRQDVGEASETGANPQGDLSREFGLATVPLAPPASVAGGSSGPKIVHVAHKEVSPSLPDRDSASEPHKGRGGVQGYYPPPSDKNVRIRSEVAGVAGEWRYEFHPAEYISGTCPEGRSQHERGCACGSPSRWEWMFCPDCPALLKLTQPNLQQVEDRIVRDLNWSVRLAQSHSAKAPPAYADIKAESGSQKVQHLFGRFQT